MEHAIADKTSMQLKADLVPMTVLKLHDCQLDKIKQEMANTIASAPKYFEQAPVVIDAVAINEQLKPFLDVKGLCEVLRSFNVVPVAIRGISQKDAKLAEDNGLALLNARIAVSNDKKESAETAKQPPCAAEPKKTEKKAATPTAVSKGYTKIITKPVRSGQQIYAAGGDLLVLAAVNAGAEVIADGNIHIHGPLRGRALAGAKGDNDAHIFCQQLDAELVALAGHYLTRDQFEAPKNVKSMVHIHLRDGKIQIDIT
ncbi:MAG: septum site-determining protein MinC [Coxiellaceae bacterium]|nr:septum site-determining protein MinC [Coxiellaceae bacterium]